MTTNKETATEQIDSAADELAASSRTIRTIPAAAPPAAPTPRTDQFYREHPICEYETTAHPADCDAWLDYARQLERELTAERAQLADCREAILIHAHNCNELQQELSGAQAELVTLKKQLRRNLEHVPVGYQQTTEGLLDQLQSKLDAVNAFLDNTLPTTDQDSQWIKGWHYCKETVRRILKSQ